MFPIKRPFLEQLDRDPVGRAEVCLRDEAGSGGEGGEHRHLVHYPRHACTVRRHHQCESIFNHSYSQSTQFMFQGFLIAFTSEFIPKLVYKYEHDWNMRGYVNFTLATSPKEGWEDLGNAPCR